MKKISNENNFIYLLSTLIILLFTTSIQGYNPSLVVSIINEFVLVLVFFVSTYNLKTDKYWKYTAFIMGGVTASMFMANRLFVESSFVFDFVHISIYLVFFIGTFIFEAKQILFKEKVDVNIITGSIVLYILLGLIWTFIYLLIILLIPESFIGLQDVSWENGFSKLTYFSFVTITTLGYGDISPKNSIAEFFVLAEAIVGVFYMAIIVSSLVSAKLNKSRY